MARWKLVESHYLNTKDTQWEYKEIDRDTGRERRKQVSVPRFLNIEDPSDWTNSWGNKDNQTGEIIVCYEGKGEARDIVFFGDPTPGMMPVDDEARAISARFEQRWSYKPDTAEVSHSQSMIDRFEIEKAAAEAKPQQVEIAGLSELVTLMAAQQKNQQELIDGLVRRKL